MSDSFGAFLQGFNPRDRELQEFPEPGAADPGRRAQCAQTDAALKEDVGLGDDAFRAALQLLADEGMVTARPQTTVSSTPRRVGAPSRPGSRPCQDERSE